MLLKYIQKKLNSLVLYKVVESNEIFAGYKFNLNYLRLTQINSCQLKIML